MLRWETQTGLTQQYYRDPPLVDVAELNLDSSHTIATTDGDIVAY